MNNPLLTALGPLLMDGWEVLPIPLGDKGPPPPGTTGSAGKPLSEDELVQYASLPHNVALRLPEGIIALDFDLYSDRLTEEQYLAAYNALMKLRAPGITSGDGIQRVTLLFRAEGVENFKAAAMPGVDIIHSGYRYVMAPPSVHPNGDTYRWVYRSGSEVTMLDTPPSISDIPLLPVEWVERVEKAVVATDMRATTGDRYQGFPCRAIHTAGKQAVETIRKNPGRRSPILKIQTAMVRMTESGHRGAGIILDTIYREWASGFPGTPSKSLRAEWDRALQGALAQSHPKKQDCYCDREAARQPTRARYM